LHENHHVDRWHSICLLKNIQNFIIIIFTEDNMKQNQSGFTLIEIAIVLVIIGLLLGGVLKGQELINSAKVKNLATDFKNIPIFIYGYQDKFRALPGDDGNVANHVTGGTVCTPAATANKCVLNNGLIDGQWDATDVASESYVFWQHVRLAGMTTGSTTLGSAEYIPTNANGGILGVQSNVNFTTIKSDSAGTANTGITGTYIVCSSGILGKFVKQLDTTLDDGNTETGSMRAIKSTVTDGKSAVTSAIQDGDAYIVCMGV
jgi:prepilin-type N-terminal cleavage/methylation domain-containing protein